MKRSYSSSFGSQSQSYGAPRTYGGAFMRNVIGRRPSVAPRIGSDRRVGEMGLVRNSTMRLSDRQQKVKGINKKLKGAIQAVVEARAIKKDIIYQLNNGNNLGLNETAIATPPAFQFVFPIINQGNAVGDRAGNVVNCKELKLRYKIAMPSNTTQGATTPVYVTVWVGNVKGREWVTPQTSDFIKLLHLSTVVETGEYTQQPEGTMMPVNTEYWNIFHRKTYKIGFATGGGSTGLLTQNFNDTLSSVEDEVSLKSLCKRWYFDDNSNYPTNVGAWVFCTVVPCNGTVAPTVYPNFNAMAVGSFCDYA